MPPVIKNQSLKKSPESLLASNQPITVDASNDYSQFNLVPAASKPNPKGQAKKRKASLVYHEKGKRFEFVDEVITAIGADKSLQFAFSEQGFAVGRELPGCTADFPLYRNGDLGVVYSADLGLEAIKRFSLDFTGKSTFPFQDVVYLNSGDVTVAFFPIVQEVIPTDDLDVPASPDAKSEDLPVGHLAPDCTVSPDADDPESFAKSFVAAHPDDDYRPSQEASGV